MNVAVRQPRPMTVAEFIDLIRPFPDEERWELLDGVPVLMSPQSERHQRIVFNIMNALAGPARRRDCWPLPGLGLLNDEWDHYAPIPDVVVRCGAMGEGGYAKDPVFIAEVLSPSTMNNDRGRKVDFYKALASLRTLLVVYQDERRVEAWQRDGEEWRFAVHRGHSSVIACPELGASLSMADIYDRIDLLDLG